MNKMMRQKARIGMALALPEFLKGKMKPGRFANCVGRVRRQAEKRIGYMIGRGYLNRLEEKEMIQKMEEFSQATGWTKEKHIATYIAFLLALFDKYPEEGIIAALNDLASFLEDGGDSPSACMPAGALAFEKWERIFGGDK